MYYKAHDGSRIITPLGERDMTGFIVYFVLLSIVHLFFCYFGMHTPRKLTKPLLLLSLCIYYACAAKPVDAAVLAALIGGLAGDILLISEDTGRAFIAGALSFTLGHGLYALSIFRCTPGATQPRLITAAVFIAIYVIVVAYMSFRLEKHVDDKKFRILMPVYLSIVAAVNVFAWVNLVLRIKSGEGQFYAALITLGAILFLASDTILARSMFARDVKRPNFPVMLTYIPAQALLCFGFIGLGA